MPNRMPGKQKCVHGVYTIIDKFRMLQIFHVFALQKGADVLACRAVKAISDFTVLVQSPAGWSPAASLRLYLFCSTQQHVSKLLIHQCAERGAPAGLTLRASGSLHNWKEHHKKMNNFDGMHRRPQPLPQQLSMRRDDIHYLACSFIDIAWLNGSQRGTNTEDVRPISDGIYTPTQQDGLLAF